MTIKETNLEDAGDYHIRASNIAGEASASFKILVKGKIVFTCQFALIFKNTQIAFYINKNKPFLIIICHLYFNLVHFYVSKCKTKRHLLHVLQLNHRILFE